MAVNINNNHSVEQLDNVIRKTVRSTLIELGLDLDDPIELQKDFALLRAWREGSEEVKRKGFVAIVGVMAAGMLGYIWIGFKNSLH